MCWADTIETEWTKKRKTIWTHDLRHLGDKQSDMGAVMART